MTAAGLIALIGVGVLVSGAVVCALRGGLGAGLVAQAVGVALLGVAGAVPLLGGPDLGAGFRSTIAPALGIDGLSGFFLVVLAITAVPTLVFAYPYLRASGAARLVGPLTGAFLLALVGLLAARDVTTFLASWELMTLIPAAAILTVRRDDTVRSAVFAYVAITHIGGAGVWVAMLVLAAHGAIGDPAALAQAGVGVQTLVAVSALIGFGTKAGFVPLHSWLPRAHPVAPAPLSALMSGVMIKFAIYGLIRVEFEWLGATPLWLGICLLAIGLVSALGGVLWAIVQHELKRLLAFHSIENVGIIALGLGASLVFAHAGAREWSQIAFAAALLHIANHAVFKSLLFLGAGAFERTVGSLDLDRLGGLLARMPWTAGAFLIGAMSIAGLPPLNGFASEWLTLQSLLHAALSPPVGVALVAAVCLAGLAATAALALLCFVKVIGLVLLGPPRRPEVAEATEAPLGMRIGMSALAAMCIAIGLVPGLILPTLAGLAPGGGGAELQRQAGLSIPGTGSYPALAIALALVAVFAVLRRARGRRSAAPAPSWACGQAVVPALGWTSAGVLQAVAAGA